MKINLSASTVVKSLQSVRDVVNQLLLGIQKHWKLILLLMAGILILGGLNEIRSCSINSKLNSDLANLRTNNAALVSNNNYLSGYAADLGRQIGQSTQLVSGLKLQNQRLTNSLNTIQSDNTQLAKRLSDSQSEVSGLQQQLANSSGFVSTISSDNSTASGLIGQVSADIKTAIRQNPGPSKTSK
jgi:chromosome segregation ATPase